MDSYSRSGTTKDKCTFSIPRQMSLSSSSPIIQRLSERLLSVETRELSTTSLLAATTASSLSMMSEISTAHPLAEALEVSTATRRGSPTSNPLPMAGFWRAGERVLLEALGG